MAARKTLDVDSRKAIRLEWGAIAEKAEKTLENLKIDMQKLHDEAFSLVEWLSSSKYVSYKVSPKVIDYLKNHKLIEALNVVHTATYKIQDVSSDFRLVFKPQAIDLMNDTETIMYHLRMDFVGDLHNTVIFGTNAEIEREQEFVNKRCEVVADQIRTLNSKIQEYVSFVEEQSYAISRLDSMLKLNDSIIRASMFSSATSGDRQHEV